MVCGRISPGICGPLILLSADGDVTDPLVLAENKQIMEAVRQEKEAAAYSGWIELCRPGPNLRRFTLALCLPAIQQFTGINAITYCESILEQLLFLESKRVEAHEILDAPAIFASAGINDFHYQILLNAGNTTFGMLMLCPEKSSAYCA